VTTIKPGRVKNGLFLKKSWSLSLTFPYHECRADNHGKVEELVQHLPLVHATEFIKNCKIKKHHFSVCSVLIEIGIYISLINKSIKILEFGNYCAFEC
jgi:hypothetical protein